MNTKRVIPFLMLHEKQLYNSVQFGNYRYIGDPLIATKIFNEKEAQEISIVDIDPSRFGTPIDFDLLADIASECFMPLSYGGGISTLEEIRKILYNGFEKVIINSAAQRDLHFIGNASKEYGSSTIVGCIDFIETADGCIVHSKHLQTKTSVVSFAKQLEDQGAGELLINNVSRDGKKTGLNTPLITELSNHLSIPIIAAGGVGNLHDVSEGLDAGANAVAASSLFVYKGPLDAVLINYPDREVVNQIRRKHG